MKCVNKMFLLRSSKYLLCTGKANAPIANIGIDFAEFTAKIYYDCIFGFGFEKTRQSICIIPFPFSFNQDLSSHIRIFA